MKKLIITSLLALSIAACGGKSDADKAGDTMKELVGIIKEMAKTADSNKDDCGKMAAALDKVIEANKDKLVAAKEFGDKMKSGAKDDPEKAKEMMKTMAPVMGELMESGMKLAGAMAKCGSDDKMKAVSAKWQKFQ